MGFLQLEQGRAWQGDAVGAARVVHLISISFKIGHLPSRRRCPDQEGQRHDVAAQTVN